MKSSSGLDLAPILVLTRCERGSLHMPKSLKLRDWSERMKLGLDEGCALGLVLVSRGSRLSLNLQLPPPPGTLSSSTGVSEDAWFWIEAGRSCPRESED